MSAPNTTPGPWAVTLSPTAGRFNLFGETHVGSFVSGSRQRVSQGLADARLIAAAPDMYEALEDLIYACADHYLDTSAARAALAKARGEAA